MKLLSLIGILLFLSESKSENVEERVKGPIITTPYGPVEGFVHTTDSNIDVNVFLGIRYAESPDNIFRFEKPKVVEKWSPIVHHARRFRAACIPFHREALTLENYSEDCLFVNIVTPQNNNPSKKYPVFVFIHGGGFEIGDAETYGYKNASENLVTKDIIFVSVQYRLGPLGFFTTGDNQMPGNLGLWDVAMSLTFLHQVLPSFGGDVDRITLSGHSAGSSIVSAMMFSPQGDHLFNQAIELSGSVFAEYSMSESVVQESRALADSVGCKMTDSKQLKECMKERTLDEILDGVEQIGSSRRHSNFLKFHPHFDKDFFPFPVDDMVRKAPKKQSMQGITDKESGMFGVMEGIDYVSDLRVPEANWTNYSKEDLMEFMLTAVVTEEEFGRKMGPFVQLLQEFYIHDNDPEIERSSSFYMNSYVDLLSDLQFHIPSVHEIELKRKYNWESFYYVIDYVSESRRQPNLPIQGAFHAAELPFLLEFMGLEKMPLSENDKKFQKSFLGSIIQFIKTGNPSTAAAPWLPVSSEKPLQHMRFNENSKMMDSFRPEAVHFWLEKVPKLIGTDILKRNRLPAANAHKNVRHTEL